MNENDVTSVSTFVDTQLKLYSGHSNIRGIPFFDGFKQAQRKAIWGMLKLGENADKDTVERVSASICSHTDYHHGSSSMESCVVGLAQNFAGSNNIPLLEGHGQFGNRLKKIPAAPRYIKTKLSPMFRMLFRKEDDILLDHVISNNIKVEPKFFVPVLPMMLLNGAEGMGTGHSTKICSYSASDLKKAILKILNNKELVPGELVPSWNGFKGTVQRDTGTNQIISTGIYEFSRSKNKSIITIKELPIGIESDAYEAHLCKLEDKGIILDFDNLSDEENGFEFVIQVPNSTAEYSDEDIKKTFKLISKDTENLTVWNGDGVLKRYECTERLLEDWVLWRLEQYEERRVLQIKKIQKDISELNIKVKFINFYLKNSNFFRNASDSEIKEKMLELEFFNYDSLLAMPIRSLTKDKIAELEKNIKNLEQEMLELEGTDAVLMYNKELKELKL